MQTFTSSSFGLVDRPRKIHLRRDQRGATYVSRFTGRKMKFADTECKLNSTHPEMRFTTDPTLVSCSLCLHKMRLADA